MTRSCDYPVSGSPACGLGDTPFRVNRWSCFGVQRGRTVRSFISVPNGPDVPDRWPGRMCSPAFEPGLRASPGAPFRLWERPGTATLCVKRSGEGRSLASEASEAARTYRMKAVPDVAWLMGWTWLDAWTYTTH